MSGITRDHGHGPAGALADQVAERVDRQDLQRRFTCDGCGSTVRTSHRFPAGWLRVDARVVGDGAASFEHVGNACSTACLARVARRLDEQARRAGDVVARVRVTHDGPYVGAIRLLMTSPVGGVAQDMYRRGQNVRSEAIRQAGSDTGRLRTSIHVEQVRRGDALVTQVGSNVEHALVHHEGHGPIRPVRAQVLAFNAGGRWVFTKHVRAVPGTEYLRRALPAAKD